MTKTTKLKFEPLSEKRVYQLLDGAKCFGNFMDACSRHQEDFYVDESFMLFDFAKWIDEEIGGAGPINIQQLWKAWYHLDSTSVLIDGMFPKEYAEMWKNEFNKYKNL